MTNTDLRTPTEWETHEGIRIANRSVYRIDGRDQFTPIDYTTYKQITQGLTVSKIQKSDTVSEDEPVVLRLSPLVPKSILKERIETKIEEFKESQDWNDQTTFGLIQMGETRGAILGLKLALQIIEES